MVEDSSVVVWFSAPGFRQLAVVDVGGELVVDVGDLGPGGVPVVWGAGPTERSAVGERA